MNTFKVDVPPSEGYKVRFLKDVDVSTLEFIIDEINYFDEETESDIIIILESADLQFRVDRMDERNCYEIGFSGEIRADLDESHLQALNEKEFVVDYYLSILSDGEDLESDEDYELLYNTNIRLHSN